MDARATYSREDLLDAWLDADRTRGAHPDLADYYYRRAWAMLGAFGWGPALDFTRTHPEHRLLFRLFQAAVENYNRERLPWGRVLVGKRPPDYAEVISRHHQQIAAGVDAVRAAYRSLLLDLMERIWGVGPEASVFREALLQEGFDPDAPEPDWDRYW
jgi:hypothetical protein